MDLINLFTLNTNSGSCSCQAEAFPLAKPGIALFDGVAKKLAEELASPAMLIEARRQGKNIWEVKRDRDLNRPAQIRKFYDELCMWEQKTKDVETFARQLPLIKMMNAKVAYARGRELVDDKFVAWFSTCMAQIRDANEEGLTIFRNFRTLFEAFLGFYKQVRPN
jgi:CRISPR-associated protein Csm2